MKRILAMTAAALMSTSMLAAPALAQVSADTDLNATGGAEVETKTPAVDVEGDMSADTDVDADTTQAIGTEANFDSVISAIGANGTSAAEIKTMEMADAATVNVVSVSELKGHDAAALDSAVSDNQSAIDELHASLESNTALKQKLDAESVDVSQIVAADVAADGAITVYVR